jgi:hypothetical protein
MADIPLCLSSESKTKCFQVTVQKLEEFINISILLWQHVSVLLDNPQESIQRYEVQSVHIMYFGIPYYLQTLLILIIWTIFCILVWHWVPKLYLITVHRYGMGRLYVMCSNLMDMYWAIQWSSWHNCVKTEHKLLQCDCFLNSCFIFFLYMPVITTPDKFISYSSLL